MHTSAIAVAVSRVTGPTRSVCRLEMFGYSDHCLNVPNHIMLSCITLKCIERLVSLSIWSLKLSNLCNLICHEAVGHLPKSDDLVRTLGQRLESLESRRQARNSDGFFACSILEICTVTRWISLVRCTTGNSDLHEIGGPIGGSPFFQFFFHQSARKLVLAQCDEKRRSEALQTRNLMQFLLWGGVTIWGSNSTPILHAGC